MIAIELPGFPVAKKNNRLNFKSGKSLPNKRYVIWNKMAVAESKHQYRGAIVKSCEIEVEVLLPDRRRRDLDNMLTSVCDMLVDAEILEDDSIQNVARKEVKGAIDPDLEHGITKIKLINCSY